MGKTELAKKIAQYVFDKKDALIKIDMSELMESHSVSKLIGSPPGYVGYGESGSLTEKVRRNPHSVILFDEIEKASSNVLNILLQILDEGRLTDSKGVEINFKNTIVVLTSNIGSENQIEEKKIGFGVKNNGEEKENKKKDGILNSLKEYLSPEFLNRINEILIFKSLGKEDLKKILKIELKNVLSRLEKENIEVDVDENILEKIIDEKYNFDYGARPLKRLIETKILNPLSEEILNKKDDVDKIKIILNKDKISFKFLKNSKKMEKEKEMVF